MTGVLTGGDTDELVAGTGEDGAEAAPTQTSTATRPRLRRTPHDDCQSPPGALVSAEDGSPSASSTRSSVTGVSPQADSPFWLFFLSGETQLGSGHGDAKWVEGSIFDPRRD